MKKFIYFLIIGFSIHLSGQNPNCNSNEFYVIGNGGQQFGTVILKFDLTSPTGPVTYNGSTSTNVISSPFISNLNNSGYDWWTGLAIADFGGGESFYAASNNFLDGEYELLKYTGNQWETVGPHSFVNQLGGNGSHLYFQAHVIEGYLERDRIQYYNGSSLTTVWESQDDNDRLKSADATVDDDGNVYFLTGVLGEDSTKLNIMKPDGEIIAQYPITLESDYTSGSFFMNNKLYFYTGIHKKLTPVRFTSSGVVVENQIPLPLIQIGVTPNGVVYFVGSDAATCNKFNLELSIKEFSEQDMVKIFPNPVVDDLNYSSREEISQVELFNLSGSKLGNLEFRGSEGKISLRRYEPGIYLVRFTLSNGKQNIVKVIKK